MIKEDINACDLHYIGTRDTPRIRARIYDAAGRSDTGSPELIRWPYLACGRSDNIPMNSGYTAFKLAYKEMERALVPELAAHLTQHPFAELDVAFHYHAFDASGPNDSAWMKYRIALVEPEYYI